MSKQGRVVAIYHKKTRKVLGHIPVDVILRQTDGYRPKYRVPVRASLYDWGGSTIVYEVAHDGKGNPIKVIANDQKEANILIVSQRPTTSELIAALLNEPNALLEGLELKV